ncbi:MAG: DRTGG domain-containing protein [bacterium]
MTVKQLQQQLGLKAVNEVSDKNIEGVFVSDMVSDVMAGAKAGNIWVTVQTHKNVIAAANLIDIPAIVIVRDKQIPQDTIEMANKVGITIFTSPLDSYSLAVRLYQAGIKPSS